MYQLFFDCISFRIVSSWLISVVAACCQLGPECDPKPDYPAAQLSQTSAATCRAATRDRPAGPAPCPCSAPATSGADRADTGCTPHAAHHGSLACDRYGRQHGRHRTENHTRAPNASTLGQGHRGVGKFHAGVVESSSLALPPRLLSHHVSNPLVGRLSLGLARPSEGERPLGVWGERSPPNFTHFHCPAHSGSPSGSPPAHPSGSPSAPGAGPISKVAGS